MSFSNVIIKFFGPYRATKIKTFEGLEGMGYNTTVTKNGKPLVKVIDDASGGPCTFHWNNTDPTLIAKEKAAMADFARDRALASAAQIGLTFSPEEDDKGFICESFVTEMINNEDFFRKLAAKAKKKLMSYLPGTEDAWGIPQEILSYKQAYTPSSLEQLVAYLKKQGNGYIAIDPAEFPVLKKTRQS